MEHHLMKAMVQTGYGPPSEVLELREVLRPVPEDDQVLVKVQAASVTFGDLAAVKGEPVIDKSYPLSELPQALQYYAGGRSRGKVIVTLEQ